MTTRGDAVTMVVSLLLVTANGWVTPGRAGRQLIDEGTARLLINPCPPCRAYLAPARRRCDRSTERQPNRASVTTRVSTGSRPANPSSPRPLEHHQCDNIVTTSEKTSKQPDDFAGSAVAFLTIDLLHGITDTAEADALEVLAAVLAGAHVLDDLSPADAYRVAETVAFEAIRCDWALADAAGAVTDRAIAAQLDRGADLDDRMEVGIALHRAAGPHPPRHPRTP